MKKNICARLFTLLLCLVILSGISAFSVFAASEYVVPEWEIDEDLTYLNGGGKRFDRYYVKGAFYTDAKTKYYFMKDVFYDGSYCQVYGESAYPHIVSVMTSPGYSTIFVDAEGKAILDAFLDKSDCIYYLEKLGISTSYTKLDKDTVDALDTAYRNSGATLAEVEVAELFEATELLEITVHDKTETMAYQHGAVYMMPDGNYYYVCFEDLDNSHFDADGYFSYRSGSVNAYVLDADECSDIDEAFALMIPKTKKSIYESSVVNGYYDVNGNPIDRSDREENEGEYEDDSSMVDVFFVTVAIIGIVIPGAVLAVGLLLANSRKTGQAKCWYALAIAATVWMLSAILFMLLVII